MDPAAEDWTDPHDPGLWADTIHPDDRGHQLVADHLAPLLRALVGDRSTGRAPATVLG